jgi:hypothetical protein
MRFRIAGFSRKRGAVPARSATDRLATVSRL